MMKPRSRSLGEFTDKALLYDKYRPAYSDEYLSYLVGEIGGGAGSLVADVGAGTGIHSSLLLKTGCRLVAVEPNPDMAGVCREKLGDGVEVLVRSAEDSGLPAKTFDFVTVAQAFHLFDQVRSVDEFKRILKPSGTLVLTWNSKDHGNDVFAAQEEAVAECCPLYRPEVHARTLDRDKYAHFFKQGTYRYANLRGDTTEKLTLETFIGRTMSASYAPLPGTKAAAKLRDRLTEVFEAYGGVDGILVEQSTIVYSGEVSR